MSVDCPTQIEKETLQQFYYACRKLLTQNIVYKVAVQKAFEEAIHGFTKEKSWRPTHISPAAAKDAVEGNSKNVQRAHGVLEERLDRYDRTLKILTDDEVEFDVWWKFYMHHDTTVMCTRTEHASGKKFHVDELIEIPHTETDLFTTSGFGFKMRKKQEIAWLKKELEKLTCPGTTE